MLILFKTLNIMSILESLAFHVNFYYGLICVWDMYVYI